jgi:hypothetical protein
VTTISECIEFVKKQIEYQDRRATVTREDKLKLHFHIETAKQFRSLLQFLEDTQSKDLHKTPNITGIDPTGALMPKELIGLPQELIDELITGGGIDPQELMIVQLIEGAGGMLSLNRIQIGIYKNSGEIIKRPNLTAKLYRMVQSGMILRMPKKKGIYTTDSSLGVSTSEEES